ncbi:MAG: EF-hand domain-containing protein [Proteobacteria bacterium]|nr:EF-hand domain-containing protein [Pseudomonadota bacterium]
MPSKAFLGLTSLASVAVALGLAGVAMGQAAPAGHKPAPGPVTHDEAMKRAHDMFARLDANHDGKITAEEVAQAQAHMRQMMRDKLFDALDANHDGQISKAEWAAAADRRAQRMAERREHMGEHGPMGGPGMGGEGGHGPMGHGGMRHHMRGRMGGHGAAAFLARFDANGDGVVSEQEFMAKAEARFQHMDRNHDGVITPDERQMGGRWGGHGRHHGGPDGHGDADKK